MTKAQADFLGRIARRAFELTQDLAVAAGVEDADRAEPLSPSNARITVSLCKMGEVAIPYLLGGVSSLRCQTWFPAWS
jgi:hypothetical protein